MNKKFSISSLLFLIGFTVMAGNPSGKGMNIKIEVKGLENSKMILANYYGDKQYVKDTFQFDSKGAVYFKADTMLPGGIYLAVIPAMSNRYFEFILTEPHFSIETDTFDLAGHVKVKESVENGFFYDDMKFLAKMKKQADSLNVLFKAAKDQKEKDRYKDELNQVDKTVKDERNDIIIKHPELFYSKLLRAMKDIVVPDPPKDANGKIIDSSFQWRYYKAHYWDNVDLTDSRLLRCPIFHPKLKTFMTQTIVQIPDSINSAGDDLLAKTNIMKDHMDEMYRYILGYIFNDMANSKVMGFDACYVHFGEKYFCSGMTPWVDSVKLFKICDRVHRLKPVLINTPAQRLILPTDSTETQWKALYDVKAKYTIMAFWDPDCGHCKKEIPVLAEAYHDLKKKGVDVAAYCPSIMEIEAYKQWIEFINKNNLDWINVCDPHRHSNFRWEWDVQSTPQIYILDANKIIRARRIGADQVEDFILHLENPSYRGKLNNKIDPEDEEKQEGTEK